MVIIDIEVYRDYFALGALNLKTGNTKFFEMFDGQPLDLSFREFFRRTTTISFNGLNFDLPVLVHALGNASCADLKAMSDDIIVNNRKAWQLGIEIPKRWDHIDLIELAPGQNSLKTYGGRLHAEKLQDLPYAPESLIETAERRKIVRDYCAKDLQTTALLYETLKPQIALRKQMSDQYGVDLRSKSDAQIAEAVIRHELTRMSDADIPKPKVRMNATYRYLDPEIITFKDSGLQSVFERILGHQFGLSGNGSIALPDWLAQTKIKIGGRDYQMGIGGLHSCEKKQYVEANSDYLLADFDVASYYPSIILQQKLAPKSLGKNFLTVFQTIVERRLNAKKIGDKVTADTLKITVNGTFGKLGSKYSFLYSPDLLVQTTITGQLALLMLIERMHDAGIQAVSANTDGVVLRCPRSLERKMEEVAWTWMLDTSYELERTDYRAVASRDVNNYLAIKTDGKAKGKGVFAAAGLAKNPDRLIVYEAAAKRIMHGTPYQDTIRNCRDIRQFVTLRRVTGGAVWEGEPIGKVVRFYYSTSVPSMTAIRYAKNGNMVPNSQGTKPLMDLPEAFPSDVDYRVYEEDTERLLCEVGYL